MIHIRPMTKSDVLETRHLMQLARVIDTDFHLEDYPAASHFPTLVAEVNQTIVGVAAKYHHSVHPQWPVLMVVVHPEYRRQGIGKKLHEETLKIKPPDYDIHGWQTACYEEEAEVKAFIKALHYQLRLTCHLIGLDLTKQKPSPRLARRYGHFEIVPFTKLLESTAMKQQLYDFLLTRYTEEHFWSPPMPKEHPDWQEIVFDNLRPELSFALMDGERIVAASNTLNETPDVLDICWFYSTLEYGQEAAVFFQKHLLACMFAEAKKVGLTNAALELDSTDRDKQGLLEWLPVTKNQYWQIFQLPQQNE
jgi:GNAT superfamily N-acetyltransferase